MTMRGALAPLCLAAILATAATAHAQTATVTVRVTGVESNEGQVFVGICDRGWAESECIDGQFKPARAGTMSFVFRRVPAGVYGFAAYHDVNGNNSMDRNFLGLPQEPYGFSNDIGRFAPPNFLAAQVMIEAPASNVTLRLDRMRF